jgi:molecular chaperone GrpE
MFFKNKKKIMSDNTQDNSQELDENQDNLAQDDASGDEALLNEASEEQGIDEIGKLTAELNESKDKYLRLAAEFDNFRRRNAKERIELMQTAGKDIIQSLLVVLDDSNRATKQMENTTNVDDLKSGISLVFNKLHSILQSKGLQVMDSVNQPFNPDLHEAITEVPAPTEAMKGMVIDVIEPGYYLNDKLIRHAKVIVGN